MPSGFDQFIGIDWSGAAQRGYAGIAVAVCAPGRQPPTLVPPPRGQGQWTRQAVLDWLLRALSDGQRRLIGFDFAFTLPGEARPAPELWAAIDACCAADADLLGRRYIDTDPRFWVRGTQPADWRTRPRRPTELACAAAGHGQPQSPLQLIGAKQVGKGALAGMRLLHQLCVPHAAAVTVWPFHPTPADDPRSVCVEIYPRLFIRRAGLGNAKLRSRDDLNWVLNAYNTIGTTLKSFDDHQADALVSAAGLRALSGDRTVWAAGEGQADGWIFGVPG